MRGARRLGVEDRLFSAYASVTEFRRDALTRRNLRDDELVQVVAATFLTTGSNCIDVGANEGRILGMLTQIAPAGLHIGYEPVPALADRLEIRFPHADIRRAAVSDEVGETSFVVHKRLASRSSMRSVGYLADETDTIHVPVETLDASLPTGYRPDLIKIDVEGAEWHVLNGARELLREYSPLVLFEHQRATASYYHTGPDDLYSLLVEYAGMRIFDMDGHGPYTRAALHEASETGRRWNFFATAGRG